MIKFMLITNSPKLAEYAESCNIGRVFVDLEQLGKQERQGHLDTLISQHSMSDVSKVKSSLSKTELLVRLNPLHEGSAEEVEEAIAAGADLLMLPMFRAAKEVEQFAEMVAGRVGVIPLVETYDAVKVTEEVVHIPGVVEIYIGLNDLHLDMGLAFMFEPLANGLVDQLAGVIKKAGLPFGFGGIARVGEGVIPGELVLGEHLRLGSSSVILSRTFHRESGKPSGCGVGFELKEELDKLITAGEALALRNATQVEMSHRRLRFAVKSHVARKER